MAFTIPDSLLKQINECTSGGFVLFIINDKGDIDVVQKFDTCNDFRALSATVADWGGAVSHLQAQRVGNRIVAASEDDEE